jgi:transposase
MRPGEVTLSHGEIDRLAVVQALEGGRLQQADAAWQLGVSIRQVKRLLQRYREQGPGAWRPGMGASGPTMRSASRFESTRCNSYARTTPISARPLRRKKLTEAHGLRLSRETLRQWLMTAGLWAPRRQPGRRSHPRRPRRPCCGDLIQIDDLGRTTAAHRSRSAQHPCHRGLVA